MAIAEILSEILFIVSAGFFYQSHRGNRFANVIAGTIATISSLLLFAQIVMMVVGLSRQGSTVQVDRASEKPRSRDAGPAQQIGSVAAPPTTERDANPIAPATDPERLHQREQTDSNANATPQEATVVQQPEKSHQKQDASNTISDTLVTEFSGEWISTVSPSTEISRVAIQARNGSLIVHVYGACTPAECDWGERIASLKDDSGNSYAVPTIYAFYNPGFAQYRVTLHSEANELLSYELATHFTDNSGRNDYYRHGELRKTDK